MAYDGSLKFDTKVDTSGFAKGTNTIKAQANSLKSTFLSLGKTLLAVFSVKKLIDFGKQAVNVASNLQEVQNVVDTAFGAMSYKMEEFADQAIEMYGISRLAAKQTGSTFMAMARGMGIAMDEASDMAISLTGLSADMASFYNVSQDVASTALKSVFTGETETLKQFGIVMTEANLQAFAMSQGIKKQISAMSQAEKVQLRYAFVMQQTALAQGDFARTSDSWANQTRMLSEKWKEFLGILGNGLVQVLTPVVKFLNTTMSYLIQFANTASKVLSSVFNFQDATSDVAASISNIASGTEDAAAGLNDLGDSAEEANKKANGLSGIDKLNNMTESIADSAEGAADSLMLMGGGGQYGMEINPTVNAPDTSALESSLSTTIDAIKTNLSAFLSYISTSFSPIFSNIWASLQGPMDNFKTIFSGVFGDLQSLAQPLLNYFTGSYVPYLQQAFTTMGTIVTGLFDTFNRVFSDIWNLAVFPILQNFITVLLPLFTDIGTQVWILLETIFAEVKSIFDMLWSDAIAPAIEMATKIWTDFVGVLKEFWDKWGVPIFEGIKTAVQTTGDLFKSVWEKFLKPVFDTFMKVVDKLWTKHLKPLLSNFMDFVGELVTGALEIYNKFIVPVVKWFVEKFGPPISKAISGIIKIVGDFLGGIIDAVSGIIDALKGVVKFVTGVFTGDWKKAWEGIKSIFKGIWDALVGIVKTPINLIIDAINGLLSGVISGLNALIKALNKISFDVPDWVPVIGGKTFGFNIKELSTPKIPRLATGTVIPANYGEFLAILGDNKREAEVVSPLSTMKQALKEVIQEMGEAGAGTINLNVYLSGKQIHSEVVRVDQEYRAQTGKSAFAY